jgi:hypothetical protein
MTAARWAGLGVRAAVWRAAIRVARAAVAPSPIGHRPPIPYEKRPEREIRYP